MQPLTPEGETIVNDISRRYGLSRESTINMLVAVNNGGGTMAQFSCPEYGSGQWMRGGMTMVGDMFNHGLKATVNNLCSELSNALANTRIFQPAPQGGGGGGGNNWWPDGLGRPSSSGGQNNIRYAYFPQTRRLAVQRDGQVSIFDTLDHHIGGVSQQQGGDTSLTFSSQYGTLSTLSLPLVSGPGLQPANPTNFAAPPAPPAPPSHQHQFQGQGKPQGQQAPFAQPPPQGNHGSADLLTLLEKLGQLRDAGILTPEEFAAKKTELLSRL